MQILCLKFFSPNHNIFQQFILLLFFQVTSLIRWPFSWWPPLGTLHSLADSGPVPPQTGHWAVELPSETSLSCEREEVSEVSDTQLSGSHVILVLNLVLLFIGTCPASQERDMESKFFKFSHVRKCPFLPPDFINDLAFQVEDHVLSDFWSHCSITG